MLGCRVRVIRFSNRFAGDILVSPKTPVKWLAAAALTMLQYPIELQMIHISCTYVCIVQAISSHMKWKYPCKSEQILVETFSIKIKLLWLYAKMLLKCRPATNSGQRLDTTI